MAPLLHMPEDPLNNECLKEISFDETGQLKVVPLQTEEPRGGLPEVSTVVQV